MRERKPSGLEKNGTKMHGWKMRNWKMLENKVYGTPRLFNAAACVWHTSSFQ